MYISAIVITIIMLSMPLTAFATVVDYDDEPEIQEECEERSDYDHLCNGSTGVTGLPFCDKYNATQRAELFPNVTGGFCFNRMANQINFCEEFDDLTNTYEDCRKVPGSEEFYEYLKTGGPDESCLFDVYQEKCLPDPVTDECPPHFGENEDGYCFPTPMGEWTCPEGYHSMDEDESGQCYPNEGDTGCEYDTMILTQTDDGDDTCAYYKIDCDLNEDHKLCNGEERTDGIEVCDQPDHPGYKFCNDAKSGDD